MALGFTEVAATEAFIACQRNEELAASLLFDHEVNEMEHEGDGEEEGEEEEEGEGEGEGEEGDGDGNDHEGRY